MNNHNKSNLIIISVIALLSIACSKESESQLYIGSTAVDTTTVLSGIDTPWELLYGPDGYLWFTERSGKVSRFSPLTGESTIILTIQDVLEYGEAGLLGMALHPEFDAYPWVYLVYNYSSGEFIKERLVRYVWNGSALTDGIILINNIPANSYHNGSRLAFGPDGKLYMSTGDAGFTSNSQNPNSLAGKILRINPDGSIPADNPVAGSYIWASGLRNTQGLVFTPEGLLYGSDHGPNNDDELNLLQEGRNYGWPAVAGFCDLPDELTFCQQNNVREPLYAWTPTLAVAGIDYYNHPSIPQWQNSILMTSLKASKLVSLKLSADGLSVVSADNWFDGFWGRLRDVCVSPDGKIYLAVSNRDGRGSPRPGDDRIVEIRAVSPTSDDISAIVEDSQPLVIPNPIKGAGQVKWKGLKSTGEYYILNAAGAIIASGKAAAPEFSISTALFKPGYYILRIDSENQTVSTPFLVM